MSPNPIRAEIEYLFLEMITGVIIEDLKMSMEPIHHHF